MVEFEPSSGSVPPHGAVTIAATFTPRLERDINYNVIVNVKNKPSRLTLNVKGEGTAIHEALQLENADGTTVTLAPRQANTLDFGQVRTWTATLTRDLPHTCQLSFAQHEHGAG